MKSFAGLRRRFPPIILLLSLLSAFPPLATDMYLPALPQLQHEWGVSFARVNLTLVAFFISYCCFLLIHGPLSDRFGRKPPLTVGITVFIAASVLCAMSVNVETMALGRFLQGAGSSAASAVVFATSKDRFSGIMRQKVFVQIGAIVATAPLLAPMLGGWILKFLTWHWIFVLQAGLGCLALVGVYFMRETLPGKSTAGLLSVFIGYARLLTNQGYVRQLLLFSLIGMPLFAFIGGSADLYMNIMGYSAQGYSYFFAFNSMAFILAPLTFSRVSRHHSVRLLIPLAFCGMLMGGLALLLPILPLPWRLALPMLWTTFCFSFCRPAGNNLILEEVSTDVGSASSLMVFFYFVVGASGIWIFSHDWQDKQQVLALMVLLVATVALFLWFLHAILPGPGSENRADAQGNPKG
ncbi:MAG: multidrug effflux MFS transporter [Desulfobulbaceae bacterium]|nr:multidrug effflux MFS transporter [Desulfobulbaceae bacterium]